MNGGAILRFAALCVFSHAAVSVWSWCAEVAIMLSCRVALPLAFEVDDGALPSFHQIDMGIPGRLACIQLFLLFLPQDPGIPGRACIL